MEREADAVVGDTVLREVIGADLFAAVSRPDHGFALFGQRLLLLLHFDFVEAGAQHAHTFFAVLDLGFLVLATDYRVGGNVRDADGGVRRVHRLAAWAGGAEGVNAQIFGFDLDVDVFGFRQHRDGDGGGVHASLLLGGGNALHAMHAAFVLELRKNAVAFDDGDDFLQASGRRLRRGEYLHLPALRLGIAGVHAEDFGGEESGFVSAGAGADFEDDVLFVVGVFGQQQDFQLFFDGGDAGLQLVEFFLSVSAHLGIFFVGEHSFTFGYAAREILVFAILLDDGRDLAVRLGSLLVSSRVVDDIRRSESAGQLFVAGFDLV